jgi:hypothetical protein
MSNSLYELTDEQRRVLSPDPTGDETPYDKCGFPPLGIDLADQQGYPYQPFESTWYDVRRKVTRRSYARKLKWARCHL